MFAIKLTQSNWPEIKAHEQLIDSDKNFMMNVLLPSGREYFYIRGYVSTRGVVHSSAILPGFVFRRRFDYDTEKIQTGWNQIVRLETP